MDPNEYSIREVRPDEIEAMRALDRATGHPVGKSDSDFSCTKAGSPFVRTVLVIESAPAGLLSGFVVARGVNQDWEIENIVIAEAGRRHGLGLRLLEHVISSVVAGGGARLSLEVRASNQAAIRLYRKAQFAEVGIRKGYYRDPVEDALLFSLSLQNSS